MLFAIGDYLAGMLISITTTLAVRAIVWPGMDMVAMLLGMAAGMVLHLVLGLVLAPLLGMFETMMPGSLIGMYGGMLFGMRDSMAAGSLTLPAAVGAIFGCGAGRERAPARRRRAGAGGGNSAAEDRGIPEPSWAWADRSGRRSPRRDRQSSLDGGAPRSGAARARLGGSRSAAAPSCGSRRSTPSRRCSG
jgi:hypothetical protein